MKRKPFSQLDDSNALHPSSSDHIWKIGDCILDTYEVMDIFTSGGMGIVYKVFHKAWGEYLVVKSPRPELLNDQSQVGEFIHEAMTWVNIGLHPNVVSCYYVRNVAGIPKIFAEYIDGGSLRDWIETKKLYENGPEKALEKIFEIAILSAWGILYAHEQGVIHQDIKPANILLSTNGMVKITDFGIARARQKLETDSTRDSHISILVTTGGMTPAYCSPEQASRKSLGRQTDIWSWALTVLEMFIGERTWLAGPTGSDVIAEFSIREGQHPNIPQMPKPLYQLLVDCLNETPGLRPQGFDTIANKLYVIFREVFHRPFPIGRPAQSPNSAENLSNRAVSEIDLGNIDKARMIFDQAVKEHPNHPDLVYNRGIFLWRYGYITDKSIVRDFQQRHQSFPENWKYLYYLALIYWECGDIHSAQEMANQCLSLADHESVQTLCMQLANEQGIQIQKLGKLPAKLQAISQHHDFLVTSGGSQLSLSHTNLDLFWQNSGVGSLEITALSICYKRNLIISAAKDKRIRFWNYETGKCLFVSDFLSSHITCLACHPDFNVVYGSTNDGDLIIWDLQSLQILHQEKVVPAVLQLKITNDGEFLFLFGQFVIYIWKIQGKVTFTKNYEWKYEFDDLSYQTIGNFITYADFCSKSQRVYAGTSKGKIYIVDLATGQESVIQLGPQEDYSYYVHALSVSPDDNFLVFLLNRKIRLFSLSAQKEIFAFPWIARNLSFSPDGKLLFINAIVCPFDLLINECNKGVRLYEQSTVKESTFSFTANMFDITANDYQDSGSLFAVGDKAGTIQVWKMGTKFGTGEILHTISTIIPPDHNEETGFEGHSEEITCVVNTPEWYEIISGSLDRTVRVWNVETGKCVRVISGFNQVQAMTLTPDNHYLIVGTRQEGEIHLVNYEYQEQVETLKGHTAGITSLTTYEQDGVTYLVSSSWDSTIIVWDLDKRAQIQVLKGHTKGINGFTILDDHRLLISYGGDKTIQVWNMQDGKSLKSFTMEENLRFIQATSEGRFLITATDELSKCLKIGEVESGRCIRTIDELNITSPILVSPNHPGRYFFSDGTWELYCLEINENIPVLPYQILKPINVILLMSDKQQFDLLLERAREQILQNRFSEAVVFLKEAHQKKHFGYSTEWIDAWSKLDEFGIRTTIFEPLLLGRISLWKELAEINDRSMRIHYTSCLLGNHRIVFGHNSHGILVYDPRTLKLLFKIDTFSNINGSRYTMRPQEARISLDWKYLCLAAGTQDNIFTCNDLLVIDLDNGSLRLFSGNRYEFKAILFSPNKKWVATTPRDERDNFNRIWELASGRCLFTLPGHKGETTALAFSPDCRFLATGSSQYENGQIHIWELSTKTLIRKLSLIDIDPEYEPGSNFTDTVDKLTFSRDGRSITALIHDKLFTWDIEKGKIVQISNKEKGGKGNREPNVSQNGKYKVTQDDDQHFKVWYLAWEHDFQENNTFNDEIMSLLSDFLFLYPPIQKGWINKKIVTTQPVATV